MEKIGLDSWAGGKSDRVPSRLRNDLNSARAANIAVAHSHAVGLGIKS